MGEEEREEDGGRGSRGREGGGRWREWWGNLNDQLRVCIYKEFIHKNGRWRCEC